MTASGPWECGQNEDRFTQPVRIGASAGGYDGARMLIGPRTIVCACGVGADLHFAVIEASALGVRATTGPVVRDVLHASPDVLRRAAPGLPRTGTVVFVCPTEMTAVRPIGVGVSGFLSARADLHRSIGRLVPIAPENALIGLVERHGAPPGDADAQAGSDVTGYIFAARRDAMDAWTEKVRTIVGRGPDAVLSPAMALIGVGGQRTESLVALERTSTGAQLAHSFRFGRATELAQPIDSDRLASIQSAGAVVRSIPTPSGAHEHVGTIPLSPTELAIGGGMAMVMGGGEFAPLIGAPPRATPRWAPGIAAMIGAVVLVWGAIAVRGYRYEHAIESLAREEATLDAEVARVQSMRAESARLTSLVRDGVGATTARWSPRLPDVAAVASIIPDGSYLYSIGVSNAGVNIQGEAPKASTVLGALEASPRFAKADRRDPTVAIPEKSTEIFSLHAEFERPAPATSPNQGGSTP